MKIGLFGGTFDPIHKGHIDLAHIVLKECSLDQIYFIPSGISHFKGETTDKWHRFHMVELAVRNESNFMVSDVDTIREGNSYTCDTVSFFLSKFPSDSFYWIMGSDTFLQIESWMNYTYLLTNISFVVYMRPGDDEQAVLNLKNKFQNTFHTDIQIIDNIKFSISSTDIRAHVKDSEYLNHTIHSNVLQYILDHKLYQDPSCE